MQRIRPYLALLITSVLLLMPFRAGPAHGAPGDVTIKLNGETVSSDVPAYIDTNGRTMVPVRFVMQALGSQVEWDGDRQQVSILGRGETIQLWINTSQVMVNGKTVELDTVPVLKNNRTMVPLRFVAETLGIAVKWVGESATVELFQRETTPATYRTAVVTGNVVNIRTGPDTSYERIGQVPEGSRLLVLEQQGEWFKVQLPDKKKGWVASWLVRVEGEDQQGSDTQEPAPGSQAEPTPLPHTARVAVVMADVVNVRSGPGTDRPLVTRVSLGQRLEVLGQEGDWYRVRIKDKEGWIAGWLVDVREVVPVPPFDGNGEIKRPVLEIKKSAIIMGEIVNVRAGPDISSPLVTQVPLGTRLEILGEQGRWYKVKIPGGTGWVARWLVATHMVANRPENGNAGDNPESPTWSANLAGRTIVIDAGHGSLQPGDWTDPGAIGPTGLKERDVVLDISWWVSELLLAEGATVIMTRTGDTNLTLPERSAVANNNGADILVSIHANASPSRSQAGTSTYYHAPWGTELETQVESRKRLARSIQVELLQKLQRQDQGVREANFSVLRNSMVPSVLVETAFISNPEEERLLGDPAFRARAAEGIVNGIKRYLTSQ